MNRTKIEYLDYTWNPTVGCSGILCAVREHCWARRMAKRQKEHCSLCYDFTPHVHLERFTEPYHLIKGGSRIGVSFMGDFFDTCIREEWHEQILNTIRANCRHTFLILTKQPQIIVYRDDWPGNLWIGVSVNRKADLERIERLRERVNGIVRFVSFEPLYEDLGNIDLAGIDWVIIGAQTRPTLQPEKKWIADLAVQAHEREIPVFMKNNLDFQPRIQEFPVAVEGGCSS
jgi:protein gp37